MLPKVPPKYPPKIPPKTSYLRIFESLGTMQINLVRLICPQNIIGPMSIVRCSCQADRLIKTNIVHKIF